MRSNKYRTKPALATAAAERTIPEATAISVSSATSEPIPAAISSARWGVEPPGMLHHSRGPAVDADGCDRIHVGKLQNEHVRHFEEIYRCRMQGRSGSQRV